MARALAGMQPSYTSIGSPPPHHRPSTLQAPQAFTLLGWGYACGLADRVAPTRPRARTRMPAAHRAARAAAWDRVPCGVAPVPRAVQVIGVEPRVMRSFDAFSGESSSSCPECESRPRRPQGRWAAGPMSRTPAASSQGVSKTRVQPSRRLSLVRPRRHRQPSPRLRPHCPR
jgi:hypothetical protein